MSLRYEPSSEPLKPECDFKYCNAFAREEGFQALVRTMYQVLDKTLTYPDSTYKIKIWSFPEVWYKIVPGLGALFYEGVGIYEVTFAGLLLIAGRLLKT